MKPKKVIIKLSNQGFTITELLVAMAISSIIMAALYSSYYSQQRSYAAQEQVVDMQQNLRSAFYFIERDIRKAGCNPTGNAYVGIQTADPATIRVTTDITDVSGTGDPDGNTSGPDEDVTYYLNSGNLVRNADTEIIAENIEVLDFVYLTESGTTTSASTSIRSVQITLVAKTGKGEQGYMDTRTYYNGQGQEILPAQNDNYHRKRLTTQVQCRNFNF
jgi:type IV pilus assembly protein PilW